MIGGAFEPDYVEPFLRRLAVQVNGTEAFAFDISDFSNGVRPQLICHIRPNGASPEVVEAAREAAISLVEPCVRQRKDGILTISDTTPSRMGLQYCLISLMYDSADRTKPVGVMAIITRCLTEREARARLGLIQGAPQASVANSPASQEVRSTESSLDTRVSLGRKIIAAVLVLHGATMVGLVVFVIARNHQAAFSLKIAFTIAFAISEFVLACLYLRRRDSALR